MTSNKRWETIWFLFVAILINYTIRVNMSIAAPKMKDVLNWTEKEKGYVLSSFFWGYAISQIPATIIAERIGPKIVFGFAVFASSFFTILMPTASKYSLALALLCRASVGFASGALFPSLYHFFKYWIPVHEKTIMVTSVTSACYVVCM
jgi:sugar phosphate permease